MKPIRKGPRNRGPFAGAEPTQASPRPFPAPIWITLVVQKRKGLDRRVTKTKIVLYDVSGKPTGIKFPEAVAVLKGRGRKGTKGKIRFILPIKATGAPPIVVRVKPIKVVSLVEFLRRRPAIKTTFEKVFGKPTSKPPVRQPNVLSDVTSNRSRRSYIQGKVKLGKPTKTVVVVVTVKPQHIKTLLQVARKRAKMSTKLGKVYGKPTTRTIVRAPKVLSFANKEATRKRRYVPVKLVIGKVPRNFNGNPAGSVVLIYTGPTQADGITLHQGISKPHIVLIPVGGGLYTVVKDGAVTEMNASVVHKETYIIDGNLP